MTCPEVIWWTLEASMAGGSLQIDAKDTQVPPMKDGPLMLIVVLAVS